MKKETNTMNFTLRIDKDLYAKARSACFRDEMQVTDLMRQCFSEGVEALIKKQQVEGYKCQLA